MPCIAVASPSRARYANSPAANWARPPNVAANGNRYCGVPASPYQPAMCAATISVAPAKPNSPRIDGAAIGVSTIRAGIPSNSRSSDPPPSPVVVMPGGACACALIETSCIEGFEPPPTW